MGETRKKLLLAVYTVFAQARQDRGLLALKVRVNMAAGGVMGRKFRVCE